MAAIAAARVVMRMSKLDMGDLRFFVGLDKTRQIKVFLLYKTLFASKSRHSAFGFNLCTGNPRLDGRFRPVYA